MSLRPSSQQFSMAIERPLESLGNYTLVRQISSGSLSTVHLAQTVDRADKVREFAIKRIHPRLANDPERTLAFKRHSEICSYASVDGLLLNFGASNEAVPQVAMPYCAGSDLKTLIERSRIRGLDPSRYAIALLLQALEALQHLHDGRWSTARPSPLVHQAPSARHILVDAQGQVKLTDLSLATGPAFPRLEISDELLRPDEMSPEQYYAPAHLDSRCDLFIVGISLWELLTGASLFGSGSRAESMHKVLRSNIPTPSEAGASTSAFDRICKRALQRVRTERYSLAVEMAHELRQAAAQCGLLAEPSELRRWVKDLGEEIPSSDSGARATDPARQLRSTLLGYSGPIGPVAAARSFRSPPTASVGADASVSDLLQDTERRATAFADEGGAVDFFHPPAPTKRSRPWRWAALACLVALSLLVLGRERRKLADTGRRSTASIVPLSQEAAPEAPPSVVQPGPSEAVASPRTHGVASEATAPSSVAGSNPLSPPEATSAPARVAPSSPAAAHTRRAEPSGSRPASPLPYGSSRPRGVPAASREQAGWRVLDSAPKVEIPDNPY